jgi:hypothetical protein
LRVAPFGRNQKAICKMRISRKKLPDKSEYFKLFLICSFPVHLWAYIDLMHVMPSMVLQMSDWRIVGVAAYVLDFALLESLFVFGVLFLASLLAPGGLFDIKLVQIGSLFVFAASISTVFIHLYRQWHINWLGFTNWVVVWILIGLLLFILGIIGFRRSPRIQNIFQSGIDRLVVLSMIYVSLDLLGLFVILARNIFAPL